ncbi:TonB-dependent siderophore receptor [Bradyrhizobium huanghuaihaiense]|uniref:TonB-dependent receptor n=1 Tax=Bradyrhizobium huanghuaihaiense TaxID=990078 RepID=UPI0021A9F06E|nr:TonB-dependent siderophore receptor [Bradyrhizobium sp. CB3035]UWU78221.1 TonB-dependent siderophore receptor [Bradyrhizobium sp. CB3035]
MTSRTIFAPRLRRAFLTSAAFSCLVLSTDGWAQAERPTETLDPVVVQQSARPSSRSPRRSAATRSARSLQQRNVAANTGAPPTASTGPAFAAPTLNLTGTSTAGSRLGLTRLQTPASVEVISAETISERGQQNILDAVTQNATGFTASPAPGNGGVSFNTRGFTGLGSVMTLYDGTQLYIGAGTVTFPYDTWSTERIEVLRGPASVLYGAGAVGGAINVVSKLPLWVPRNQAEVSLDSNMTRRIAVDSGGPINKDVAYRITATGNMSDGWVDRDNTSNVALHAVVQIKQNEDVTWTLSTDYGDRNPSRYFGTPLINGRLDESLRFKNYNVSDSHIRYQDSWNQVRTEWQIADGISVQNTLYYLNSQRHWKDVESYAYNLATGLINRSSYIEIFHDQQQVGNRMDAKFRGHVFGMANEFVAGFDVNSINFTHTNNSPYGGSSSVNPVNFVPGIFSSPNPTVPGFGSVTNQYALFAENRLSVTEQLSLIAGIRQDEPTVTRTDYVTPANSFEKSFSSTTWRAGAVYTPVKDLAFYGQYSTAVDPVGGIISLSSANKNFDLATGKQIEVGVKQSFWNGRGEWTLAGYEIVKNNLLARDPNIPSLTVQVGQQSSRGVEASVGFLLDYGWRIDANTAFLRAKYDDFVQAVGGGSVNYAGNVPVNVPQHVSNIWATWAFAPNWSANAGVQIVGKTYADNANTVTRPAYNIVNTSVLWKPDLNTTVSFRIYNLFDEVYTTSGGTTQWLLGMPRTAQLAVNVKF